MTARSPLRSDESAAGELGRLLYEGDDRRLEPGADSELDRLLAAARGSRMKRAPRQARRVWVLAAAALAVVGLAGTFEWHRRENKALTFVTNGVRRDGPSAIAAESEHAVDVEFSDGSVFDLEPAGRLRVDSSSATGARLTLLRGKTIAHVVHRSQSSWSVRAGPFEVQVTGTRFGASWDTTNERLSVELYEGSVQVVGGGLTVPISVRAGQRLEAGNGAGNWLLTSLEGPASAHPSTQVDPAAVASERSPAREDMATVVVGSASPGRAAAPTAEWPALLGRADFEGIVRQANDFGIERCLTNCSSNELRMLADSARYLGRYALAERCLLALRKRSPGDASSAAFLLGRLEEARDSEKALSWYEKSLEEAPSGAYAAEALAGKMRLSLRNGGLSAAAPVAAQYLEQFPGGVHAAKAREIVSQSKTRSDRP
jgi:ferric-dicitrate binding protein FerR (iron transport regulator)